MQRFGRNFNGKFQALSDRISEMVTDRAKVTINH